MALAARLVLCCGVGRCLLVPFEPPVSLFYSRVFTSIRTFSVHKVSVDLALSWLCGPPGAVSSLWPLYLKDVLVVFSHGCPLLGSLCRDCREASSLPRS